MLLFNRPSFRTGVMILKVEVNGHEYAWLLKPGDKGKTIDFGIKAADGDTSEELVAALLAKYPSFLSAAPA